MTAAPGAEAPFVRAPAAERRASPLRGFGLAHANLARLGAERGPLRALLNDFRHVPFMLRDNIPRSAIVIREAEWRDLAASPSQWDGEAARLEAQPSWLVVDAMAEGSSIVATAREVLTRYQRLAPRTNQLSRGGSFDLILAYHRELHDLGKPLVRADYDHAVDVWQWTLRLNPSAGRPLQIAALFHDIERLWSEADERIEQHAPDYQGFKNGHACEGAEIARRLLTSASLGAEESEQVAALIWGHERPRTTRTSPDEDTLADADALSFFALNSPGFADYYGFEHTRKKVRYTLRRMTPTAARLLSGVRLRADIVRHVEAVGHRLERSGEAPT